MFVAMSKLTVRLTELASGARVNEALLPQSRRTPNVAKTAEPEPSVACARRAFTPRPKPALDAGA